MRVARIIAWRIAPLAPGARMSRSAETSARWHRGEQPIVYASSTPERAALEALAHLETPLQPHALIRLQLRDVRIRALGALADGWKARNAMTRDIGDDWLAHGRTALLKVPSALCPVSHNLLIASARLRPGCMRCQRLGPFRFDHRLLQGLKDQR